MPEIVRAAVFVALAGAAVWVTGRRSRALRGVVLLATAVGVGLLATEDPGTGPRLEMGTGVHVAALGLCALLTLTALLGGGAGAGRVAPAAGLGACAAFWIGVAEPLPLWFAPLPAALVALAVLVGAGSETAREVGGRLVVVGIVITAPAIWAAVPVVLDERQRSGVPLGLLLGLLALLPASHLAAIRALHRVRAAAVDARAVSALS